MKKTALFLLVCITALFLGCQSKNEHKGIDLKVGMVPEKLTDKLFIKMDYSFTTNDEFKEIKQDLALFVHFWRKKTKEMIVQDDHPLPLPTSSWKKGSSATYSRTLYIPRFFNEYAFDYKKEEIVRLTIGLINPKFPDQKTILLQKDLTIESATDIAPAIFHDMGWYQPEMDPNAENAEEASWRWTTQKAVCIIENPHKTYDLRINGGVSKKHLPDQSVTIRINDTILDQFTPENAKFNKIYSIKPEMLGEQDEFQLTIETDKTFIPSQATPGIADDRELGLQIYFLYFRDSIQ
jgi:hypothetical protein